VPGELFLKMLLLNIRPDIDKQIDMHKTSLYMKREV